MPGAIYEATAGRLFAAAYDSMLRKTEEAGLRERRRRLLESATGRVLELGAGTGLNLDLYGPAATELVLCEPSPHMARRLRRRVAETGRAAEVLEAPGERLPVADDSVDTVVATLVLCTVDDVEATLREVARVLKPDGRLLFIEHVRSDEPGGARWQDRLEGVWGYVGAGCHPNRNTVAALERSPLRVESVDHGKMPKAPPIVRPLVQGAAVPRA
jgi:ubiquinone/menaquinone biosynthesis C-methylase UbiE